MKITVELDGTNGAHLLALAALVDVLGGQPPVTLAPDGYAPPPPPVVVESTPIPPAPPAPAVVVPPPPVSNIAAPVSAGERDITGLPWDARIHTSGENRKNADGSWRKRRGVDDATVAAVTAELRGLPGAPVPPPPPTEAVVNTESVTPVVTAAASVPAPPPPPAAPTGATVSPGYGLTFQQVMAKATARGMIYEQLHGLAAQYFAVAKASDLIKTPENWDLFADLIEAWEA